MGIQPVPYIVTVERSTFKLHIRKRRPIYPRRYILTETYSIAVGKKGFKTPAGYYEITKKKLNPTWTPPDESWVGENLRDPVTHKPLTLSADNPANPLAGAFLWVIEDEAIGIHGTKDIGSLGSAASHGCIRVAPEVAKHLFRILPIGTPIIIV